jgi:hypothetical protein
VETGNAGKGRMGVESTTHGTRRGSGEPMVCSGGILVSRRASAAAVLGFSGDCRTGERPPVDGAADLAAFIVQEKIDRSVGPTAQAWRWPPCLAFGDTRCRRSGSGSYHVVAGFAGSGLPPAPVSLATQGPSMRRRFNEFDKLTAANAVCFRVFRVQVRDCSIRQLVGSAARAWKLAGRLASADARRHRPRST